MRGISCDRVASVSCTIIPPGRFAIRDLLFFFRPTLIDRKRPAAFFVLPQSSTTTAATSGKRCKALRLSRAHSRPGANLCGVPKRRDEDRGSKGRRGLPGTGGRCPL